MAEEPEHQKHRLLVVANRAPITITEKDGEYNFTSSSGGLVTAFKSLQGIDMIWIGWPGREIPECDHELITNRLLNELKVYPVFLSNRLIDLYYNGFSNNVLWPLFHYITPSIDPNEMETIEQQWEAYIEANEMFAEAVERLIQPNDYVWIQDYHLMLCPKMVRERLGAKIELKLGWFLHTPFPSYEVYRMLPYRTEILQGVLSANLAGFHVAEYVRHFLNACTRILGLSCTDKGVEMTGNEFTFCRTKALAIGIEPDMFSKQIESDEVKKIIQAEFPQNWQSKKVILGVDRLDYIKGIPHKLLAFEQLLKNHEELIGEVILIQIAVPSRTDVREYQELRSLTHEIVGRINSTYGSLGSIPVHYFDQSVNLHKLIALYCVADVLCVTSIRDGMNLVSYEYMSCQEQKHGVLVLSEFAGAAKVLGAGAILCNPWNVEETAEALFDALVMEDDEKLGRYEFCYNYIRRCDVHFWARSFLSSLQQAVAYGNEQLRQVPASLGYASYSQADAKTSQLFNTIQSSKTVLLLFDEGGPFLLRNLPRSQLHLMRQLFNELEQLAEIPNYKVMVVTGAKLEHSTLRHIQNSKIYQATENGYFIKRPNQQFEPLVDDLEADWIEGVTEVVTYFEERTPGSVSYTTNATVEWSYLAAHYEIGTNQSRDLLSHLRAGPLINVPADMAVTGASTVQIRDLRVNKLTALKEFVKSECNEEGTTVIAVGNFNWKDEEDFYDEVSDLVSQGRLKSGFLIGKGSAPSLSDFYYHNIEEIIRLVQEFKKIPFEA